MRMAVELDVPGRSQSEIDDAQLLNKTPGGKTRWPKRVQAEQLQRLWDQQQQGANQVLDSKPPQVDREQSERQPSFWWEDQ